MGIYLFFVIQLSFCHSNISPSIIGRQGELLHFVIRLSFCHSKIIHSIIERQGDLLISVIQLSFCHSNIIPCIIGRQGELLHFVIRLSFLWNDWTGGGMTELMVDWGTFFNPSILITLIPGSFRHSESFGNDNGMTNLSFDGHSEWKWPRNDLFLILECWWNDWTEGGLGIIFEQRQMP